MLRYVDRNGKGNELENRRLNDSLDSGILLKDMECEKEEFIERKLVFEIVIIVESVVYRLFENEKINVLIKYEIEEVIYIDSEIV